MKEEDIPVAAQLLTSIKDSVTRLERAVGKNDSDEIAAVKKEIIDLQRKIEALI